MSPDCLGPLSHRFRLPRSAKSYRRLQFVRALSYRVGLSPRKLSVCSLATISGTSPCSRSTKPDARWNLAWRSGRGSQLRVTIGVLSNSLISIPPIPQTVPQSLRSLAGSAVTPPQAQNSLGTARSQGQIGQQPASVQKRRRWRSTLTAHHKSRAKERLHAVEHSHQSHPKAISPRPPSRVARHVAGNLIAHNGFGV
jgi:hypothetical protein